MQLLPEFMLALAVSMDGFVVGATYGMRHIRIPLVSLLVINSVSAAGVLATMTAGELICRVAGARVSALAGAAILVLVGLWSIKEALAKRHAVQRQETLLRLRLAALGVVVQILREPVAADSDASGTISPGEAFFLGIALALDAMGAGLGAGLTGAHLVLVPATVGIGQMLLVRVGELTGQALSGRVLGTFRMVPGFILLALAVLRIAAL
ncbi:MAG: sporulation membrane protein YtaF [Bacillota bacterium]